MEHTLSMFVTYLARDGLTHQTIKSYLSAIRHYHILAGQGDPLLGCKSETNARAKQDWNAQLRPHGLECAIKAARASGMGTCNRMRKFLILQSLVSHLRSVRWLTHKRNGWQKEANVTLILGLKEEETSLRLSSHLYFSSK